MTWLKGDDAMGEHRKTRRAIRRAGLGAFGLHMLALLHASRYLTDGFVDEEFVDETFDAAKTKPRDRKVILETLVECGQWEPAEGGWTLHDYLDYNPSRSEVEAKRADEHEKKSAAGRKGAEARWSKERSGNGVAACHNGASGDVKHSGPFPSIAPSRPVPYPED